MTIISSCLRCHSSDLDQGYILSLNGQELGPICQRCGLAVMQHNMDLPHEVKRMWTLAILGEPAAEDEGMDDS